jgi:hypothetical protein
MQHITVRLSESLLENLAFLQDKWECDRSQALRLCIIYQHFAERGDNIKDFLKTSAQIREILDEGYDG